MKKIMIEFVLVGAALAVWSTLGAAETAPSATGHWEGRIQIPNHELAINLDLAKSAKGVWIGSISVLGSTSIDVPLNTIAIQETAVRFTANLPDETSFDGRISADARGFSGTAANAEGTAPFQLTRNGEAYVKVPPPSTSMPKEFEGAWEGTLKAGEKISRIGLKLASASDGIATATLIAIDQGNREIPVTTVAVNGKQLQLEARAVSGTYRGTLGPEGGISGEWAQGANRFPLNFKRVSTKLEKP